jgi:glutamate formiminotransferase / 5-formyltetrahydrofolate cyclo-ligase
VLLGVPNFSEGRSAHAIAAVTDAFLTSTELLDSHSDPVHNRTVLTLSASGDALVAALVAGAGACLRHIDLTRHDGAHPCVGALDVCPVVWVGVRDRARARELALETAIEISDLGLPVFLYGELASDERRRERAYFRRGGIGELTERMRSGELRPDFGPPEPHPTAGATLATARPPLAAFNILLDTGDVEIARAVASGLREAGGGLGGVRAVGIDLDGRAQVSTNIHDPVAVPLSAVIERVRGLAAEHGARPISGEVVGLLPEAALRDLPNDVPLVGFDLERGVIERRLPGA